MTTKELIFSMLIENTGKALGDSGDAYGRNWQRNESKTIEDFEREPEERIVWEGHYLNRRVSVFHYLSQLETDDLCDDFNSMPRNDWDWNCEELYGVSEAQWKWLQELGDIKVTQTFNTYNGDSDLSQILQGSWFTINDELYLLLQIHGGLSGGYTDAKLFRPREEYYIHEYLRDYMDSRDLTDDIEQDYAIVYDQEGNVMDNKELFKLLNKS